MEGLGAWKGLEHGKLTAVREDFLTPLQSVIGVIEQRQTMPVLANVLLSARENRLSIRGTDLEVELVATRQVSEQEAGGLGGVDGANFFTARSRSMGLSEERVQRLQSLVDEHAAKGSVPGAVGVVEQGGDRRVFVAGRMGFERLDPMRRDAIFRIASMTKPVTAVAALMLVEEGKLRVEESVDRLLPELADIRVLRTLGSSEEDTVPARRSITVEDVLTFRLGWGVLFDPDLPIQRLVGDLPGFGMPDPTSPLTPDAYMERLRRIPLMAQPGERWLYTVGSNILGVLVARAAGKSLDAVFKERIFEPLGLRDTAFWVPPEKIGRVVTGYTRQEGQWKLFDSPDGRYARPPAFPAGDSGLVSTADDFATFARFLFTGCAKDGRRMLSESLLRAMQTNYLTPEQMADGEVILGPGWGWGYGLGVQVGENPYGIRRGAYGWNGGFGTSWFNDPAENLTAVLLTQRVFDSPDPPQVHKDFWRAVCGAS